MSERPSAETCERLESSAVSRGLTVFARINFSGDAEKVGIVMRPARLLIFGSLKAGTPLMLAAPASAIDFPLKVLVSEDESGRAFLSYNPPKYLMDRHNIPEELLKDIAGTVGMVESAAAQSGG